MQRCGWIALEAAAAATHHRDTSTAGSFGASARSRNTAYRVFTELLHEANAIACASLVVRLQQVVRGVGDGDDGTVVHDGSRPLQAHARGQCKDIEDHQTLAGIRICTPR
jgi:hypothetical protein